MPRLLLLLFVCACFGVTPLFGQEGKYSRVKIYTDGAGLGKLAEMGVSIDHGEAKKDVYFISDFSYNDLQIIRQSGMKHEVLIDDVSRFYAEQNLPENLRKETVKRAPCNNAFIKKPSHFRLGTYAGFFTYEDMLSILDSMHLLYPHLISKRVPIDSTKTWEGRPV